MVACHDMAQTAHLVSRKVLFFCYHSPVNENLLGSLIQYISITCLSSSSAKASRSRSLSLSGVSNTSSTAELGLDSSPVYGKEKESYSHCSIV